MSDEGEQASAMRAGSQHSSSNFMGGSSRGVTPQHTEHSTLGDEALTTSDSQTQTPWTADRILTQVRQHHDPGWLAEIQPFAVPCLPDQLKGLFALPSRGSPFTEFSESIEPSYALTREVGNLPPSTGPWKFHIPAVKLAVIGFNVVHDLIQSAREEFGIELVLLVASVPVPNAVYRFRVGVADDCQISLNTLAEFILGRATSCHRDIPFAYKQDSELRVAFGKNSLQSSRVDGNKNSRMFRMESQPSLDSECRLQIASLSFCSHSELTALSNEPHYLPVAPGTSVNLAPGEVLTQRSFAAMQKMALFLRMSLRLNPDDISQVVHMIHQKSAWQDWPSKIRGSLSHGEFAPGIPKAGLSQMAERSLSAAIAVWKKGHGEKLRQSFSSFTALEDFGVSYSDASRADSRVWKQWLVYVHICTASSRRALQKLRPSFFHDFGTQSKFDVHVHIMDWSINNLGEFLILSTTNGKKPAQDRVKLACASLCARFGASADRLVVTDPFFYGHRSSGSVFRLDGMTNHSFARTEAGPMVRAVLGTKYRPVDDDAMLSLGSGTRDETDRQPLLLIIWLRQSGDEKSTDIVHQLWLMLRNMPEHLLPLRDSDELLIAVEKCSSTRHSWNERHMVAFVLKHIEERASHKVVILSARANRLTRQVDDIDLIHDSLANSHARWLFRHRVGDGDSADSQWYDSQEIEMILRSGLEYSREFGKQVGTYSKNRLMLNRIVDAASTHPTVLCMKRLLDYVFLLKSIQRVVIYVRVSPSRSGSAGNGKETHEFKVSVETQIDLLSRFVPDRYRESTGSLVVVRDVYISAFTTSEKQTLLSAVCEDSRRTCVLSTSIDRVTRRRDGLQTFRNAMRQGIGHYGLCFLWDHLTHMSTATGLTLQPGCETQKPVADWQACADSMRQFSPSLHHLSYLQPIFWCVPSVAGEDQLLRSHVERHVSNAEKYCFALSANNSTDERIESGLAMPSLLAQGDKGEILGTARRDRWKTFMSEYFKINRSQISFELRWYKDSFTCSCAQQQNCDGTECICNCTFCTSRHLCTCDRLSGCVCDEICSCSCGHCHDKRRVPWVSQDSIAGSSSQASSQASLLTPRVRDCDSCLSLHATCSGDKPCRKCREAGRICLWTEQEKDIALRGPIRRQQRCQVPGCINIAVGNCSRCPAHENERLVARAAQEACARPGCGRNRLIRFVYCSLRCYLGHTDIPRQCTVGGCIAVAPVGLGTRCMRHGPFCHPDDKGVLDREFAEIDRVGGWPHWPNS